MAEKSTVRSVTYDLLRSLGLTTVFGNPGSTEQPFLQEFPDDFSYVLALQEASVIAMADTFAQVTRRSAQAVPAGPALPLTEPLSRSEIRVLRYMPTNLSAPEIARERLCRCTRSGRTYATSSPSSARTAVPKRSRELAPSACSHPHRPPRTLRFSGTRQQAPAPIAFADRGRL